MCARLELTDAQVHLGESVGVWLEEGRAAWLAWTGFARNESLQRWLAMGGQPVDIPARRFAVRSTSSRLLTWEEIPLGLVLRGIVDSNSGKPLLKIVTRPASALELHKFEHPRIPLIEAPRVSAERILPPAPVGDTTVFVRSALFAN